MVLSEIMVRATGNKVFWDAVKYKTTDKSMNGIPYDDGRLRTKVPP